MKQKREKLMRALSYADDEYITEAAPRGKKPKRKFVKWTILAAALGCLLVAFNLWLFVPLDPMLPDVSMYADSPYYGVICKLNPITHIKPIYKNNFLKIWNSVKDRLFPCDCEDGGSISTSSIKIDVTVDEERGIFETDLIQRNDDCVFYLNEHTLYAYSIEGEQVDLTGSFALGDGFLGRDEKGLFLSDDGKTVTVLLRSYVYEKHDFYTHLIQVDVSDPSNMQEVNRTTVTGNYASLRLVDGVFLLIVEVDVQRPDFTDESTFLPQITTTDGTRSIASDAILMADHLYMDPVFTVVWKLDAKTLEPCGELAFFDYHSMPIYLSAEYMYLSSAYLQVENISPDGSVVKLTDMVDLSCVAYAGDGLHLLGTVALEGDYTELSSMDEKNDVFRMVMRTDDRHARPSQKGELGRYISLNYEGDGRNASLYCVDVKTWTVIASVEKFVPIDEEIQSVRFDGDRAYVTMSSERPNPVFCFELSDLNNVFFKPTDAEEQFLHSLVDFGNGFLLGKGEWEDRYQLKLEVYQKDGEEVKPIAVYEKTFFSSSSNSYKDYDIDRENQLIGFIARTADEDIWSYVLLHFDGSDLYEVAVVEFEHEVRASHPRSLYMDGYLYLFYADHFQVVAVPVS